MSHHNQRQFESKLTRSILFVVAASITLLIAIAPMGDASRTASDRSTIAAHDASNEESIRTAGLLVPKRVRLIIKYQRTALA